MAIQASLPPFSCSLEGVMEGGGRGGGLPADLWQSVQQQQMAMIMPSPLSTTTTTTTTTGFCLPSSSASVPPAIVDDFSHQLMLNLLEKERVETDQFLRQQSNQLVAALQQQTKQHAAEILQTLEGKASFLFRQRAEELTKANKRALELELCLRGAEEERAKWQQLALENEALAISLSNTLDQVRAPRFSSTNGRPSPGGRCRGCGRGDACVVLLPCCHLCSCGPCAAILEECPLCSSVKRGSVEVFLE